MSPAAGFGLRDPGSRELKFAARTVQPMPLEIEIKLRVDSHEPVRRRMNEAGAKPLETVIETNWILDRPGGSLCRKGCGLRVRSARSADGKENASWTFKGPPTIGATKSREEIETQIGDARTAVHILERLGHVVVLEYEKKRESWSLDGCDVELDEPAKLGLFVEIEGANESVIRGVQRKLGLESTEFVKASYVQLAVVYCDRHSILPRKLHF